MATWKKLVLAVLLVAAVAGLVYANRVRLAAGQSGVVVEVSPARQGVLESYVYSAGVVKPGRAEDIRTPLAGVLARFDLEVGQRVEGGQVVAVLREDEFQDRLRAARDELARAQQNLAALERRKQLGEREAELELKRAEAQLKVAEVQYKKTEALPPWDERRLAEKWTFEQAQAAYELAKLSLESQAVLPEEMDAARVALENARARYERALADLASLEITSPIPGVVMDVAAAPGATVTAGSRLATVADLDPVTVEVRVDELDIARVELGQPVKVRAMALPGHEFSGRVERISPEALREGNVAYFTVEVKVENPEELLRPGMSVDADILVEAGDGFVVPLTALVEDADDRGTLYLYEDGEVVAREVTIDLRTGTEALVTGLAEGDLVIVGVDRGEIQDLAAGDSVFLAEPTEGAGRGGDGQ